MKKLKPCPFCGEKEDISLQCKRYHGGAVEVKGNKFWFVECLPCDVRTGYCFDLDAPLFGFKDGKEMAIVQWNRRVSDEKPDMIKVHKVIEEMKN